MTYLITSATISGERLATYRGMNTNPRLFLSSSVRPESASDYERAQRQVDSVIVESDADLKAAIEAITTNFVSVDVHVFKLISVSHRVPGDLKTKEISSDGILPAK